MQIQPFVQAYLTYNEKVWLLKSRLWIPVGGHLVSKGKGPAHVRDIKYPTDVLREEIKDKAGTENYYLLHNDEAYLTRNYPTLSPRGDKIHINVVYFGRFNAMPKVEAKHSGLFELLELENMTGQLATGVLENSQLVLKLV